MKLLDFGCDLNWLEQHENPFGLIVLIHLQSIATRQNLGDRCLWKIRLAKGLLDRGWDAETVRRFFKFIDWMMDLPDELAQTFEQAIEAYEKEKNMPYITTIEQRGIEKGRQEVLFALLEERFGPLNPAIREQVVQLSEERITDLCKHILRAQSLAELGLVEPT